MGEQSDLRVPILEKNNYTVWKWQFLNVLRAKKLISLLKTDKPDSDADGKAIALLGSALNEENLGKLVNCVSFKEAWQVIEQNFENKTSYEPQSLYKQLNNFKMETADDVSSGLSFIQKIAGQLRNLGENVSDHLIIGTILSALPSSFEIFIAVWKGTGDNSVDSLVARATTEARDQQLKNMTENKALISKVRPKNRSKKLNKNQCVYCKEEGHWIKDCPNLKTPYDPNKGKKNRGDDRNKKNTKKFDEKETNLAFITRSGTIKSFAQDIWIVDTGATHHMSPYKDIFTKFTTIPNGTIQLAANVEVEICGKGEILTNKGKLLEVLYVPKLSQNLFSVSAAAVNGLNHVGSSSEMIFYFKNQEVMKASLKDKLYLMQMKPSNIDGGQASAATLNEWHQRFSHVNPDTIKRMVKSGAVEGLQINQVSKEKCEDCALNKCTNAHHPARTTSKAKSPGVVLHLDTAGPSNVASLGGSKYLLLCKDEFSRYRIAEFIKTKDQIADKVKEIIARAELETGNSVLKIRTDNGTEFSNNNLSSFLRSRGVMHECSSPYVPAQNGFIERDIRTVKEAARTILNMAKLDTNLWAEAVRTAVYTLNRSLNSSNSVKVPYELWFGHVPNVQNLRTFGEVVIVKKNPNQEKGPWTSKGFKGIFVGYTDLYNTYRILVGDKVITTCNVVFTNQLHQEKRVQNIPRTSQNLWINDEEYEDTINDMDSYPPDQGQQIIFESDYPLQTNEEDSEVENFLDTSMNPTRTEQDTPVRQEGIVDYQSLIEIDSDQQGLNDNVISMPGRSAPLVLPQASSNVIPQVSSHIPQHITVRSNNRNDRIQSIQNLFNRNKDAFFNLIDSQTNVQRTFQFKDLEYRPNAYNWINKKTGHFVQKETIERLAEGLTPRSNNVRALMAASAVSIPTNYKQAIESEHCSEWLSAMNSEIDSLIKNEVYIEVPESLINRKPVGSRWVFTVKTKPSGEIDKFKARVVAKGFSQIYGIDYTETYCSVVHVVTTRLLISYAAVKGLILRQFDIKTAFLYGSLDEEIFMLPPDGYKKNNNVWLLKRSLYGLKQSPRMWNQRFSSFLENIGFETSKYDHSVFYKKKPLTLLIVYVDDGMIFTESEQEADDIIMKLNKSFEMRELSVNVYRGIEIMKTDNGIFVHQKGYTERVLETFNMAKSNYVSVPTIELGESDSKELSSDVPYRSVVGSLAYLADTTRPDIAFAVNQLARKLAGPTENDWKRAKHLLRYLRGTSSLGILYPSRRQEKQWLIGYSDSDFAGDHTSSKSTTGYVIIFNQAPVHWKVQLQRHVTLSSSEAEVIALCSLSKELAWVRRMCMELGFIKNESALLLCDNTSAIKIATSEKATNRTRHLRAQESYVREQVDLGELEVKHVKTSEQIADFLTKPLPAGKFKLNASKLLTNLMLLNLLVCNLNIAASELLESKLVAHPHHITVKYGDVCSLIAHGEKQTKTYDPIGCGCQPCETQVYYELKQCTTYFDVITEKLMLLNNCEKRLHKRDLIDVLEMGAKVLIKVVDAAATLWLDGSSKTSEESSVTDTADKLYLKLYDKMSNSVKNFTIAPKEFALEEIYQVSPAARNRRCQVENYVPKVDVRENQLDYIVDKLKATIVLIQSLTEYCAEGKVDMQALGELISNEDLKELDSNSTILRRFELIKNKSLIIIDFDVIYELSILERINSTSIIFIILIGFLIFSYGCLIFLKLESKPDRPTESIDMNITVIE